MMMKTHLAFGIFSGLILLPFINNKFIFLFMVIICSLLPDIDIAYSYLGKYKIFRLLQWFVKHRGVIHSFTFCLAISLLLAVFFPILSVGFFVGFMGHLFCDLITSDGLKLFWPFKIEWSGRIRTGGKAEELIFISLLIVIIGIIAGYFFE